MPHSVETSWAVISTGVGLMGTMVGAPRLTPSHAMAESTREVEKRLTVVVYIRWMCIVYSHVLSECSYFLCEK